MKGSSKYLGDFVNLQGYVAPGGNGQRILLMNDFANALKQGLSVLYVSFEFYHTEVMDRLKNLVDIEELHKSNKLKGKIQNVTVYQGLKRTTTIQNINLLCKKNDFDIIMIENIELLNAGEYDELYDELYDLSVMLNMPIITSVYTNRFGSIPYYFYNNNRFNFVSVKYKSPNKILVKKNNEDSEVYSIKENLEIRKI